MYVQEYPGEAVDVAIQDQSTPTVIVKFNQVNATTTSSAIALQESDTIIIADPTGFVIGTYVIIFNADINRYYVGYATNVIGNTITLDTPIDVDYPIGSVVSATLSDMAVDGSITKQVFGIRGADVGAAVEQAIDITRIIFHCLTSSSVDLSKFGDLTSLTKGLVLRRRNGTINNIFNVKNNGEIDGITLDWKPYESSNPNQGQDGFTARLTFNGQDKMGVVVRLEPGDDLEFIVQDALQDLLLLEVVAEGSEVLR